MASVLSVFFATAPRRDPEVVKAVAESRQILDENAALVRELAAVELALARQSWKKPRSTSR